MHALVVDDSKPIRSILKVYLNKMGFQVEEACNGREGLTRLKVMSQLDLVLVDWNMPEMDGIEFVRTVREVPAYDSLPLVMITTNAELENVATALDAGANEYVMKPFTLDVIREKLILLGLMKG